MLLDLHQVPFSRFGSYMAISELADGVPAKGLYLKSVRGGDEDLGLVFRMEATFQGQFIPCRYKASESRLELSTDHGSIYLSFPEADLLRIEGHAAGLRLTAVNETYDYAIPIPGGLRAQQLLQGNQVRFISADGRAALGCAMGTIEIHRHRL